MDIKLIQSAEELRPLSRLTMERVDMKFSSKCQYLGAFLNGKLVGVVGCQRMGRTLLRYKTDGVLPEFRGRGIYTLLWRAREEMFNTGKNSVTAFCTDKSLPCYLAHGFRAVSTRSGITFVKRD